MHQKRHVAGKTPTPSTKKKVTIAAPNHTKMKHHRPCFFLFGGACLIYLVAFLLHTNSLPEDRETRLKPKRIQQDHNAIAALEKRILQMSKRLRRRQQKDETNPSIDDLKNKGKKPSQAIDIPKPCAGDDKKGSNVKPCDGDDEKQGKKTRHHTQQKHREKLQILLKEQAKQTKPTATSATQVKNKQLLKSNSNNEVTISRIAPKVDDQSQSTLPVVVRRKFAVDGYEAMKKFISSYESDDPLFLVFLSGTSSSRKRWHKDCTKAEKVVNSCFKKLPSDSKVRVLFVYIGSRSYWANRKLNLFAKDYDFKIKRLPVMLQYIKHHKTDAMIVQEHVTNPDLVNFLFNKHITDNDAKSKSISTVRSYDEMKKIIKLFDDDYPLYMFFLSGKHSRNNRPWCPYCRIAEVPIEYAFRKWSADSAKLVFVEVAKSYGEWKGPNKYKKDHKLAVYSVPQLVIPRRDMVEQMEFQKLRTSYVDIFSLRAFFEREAVLWK